MNYLIKNDFSFFNDLFFQDRFREDFFNPLPSLKKIDYPVDIYETNEGLNLEIVAVGLDRSDINIEIKNNNELHVYYIRILSNNPNPKKPVEKKMAYQGITRKEFDFVWRINDNFDLTKIQAELEKGILQIIIPINPETKSKSKEIKVTIK